MRSRLKNTIGLAVAASLATLATGCAGENAWTASRDRSYRDNIDRVVDLRIAEHVRPGSSQERWEAFKDGQFQTGQEIQNDQLRRQWQQRRQEAAEALLASPLSLSSCLATALEFNPQIQADREVLVSMAGERLISQSRKLPSLHYDLTAAVGGGLADTVRQGGIAMINLLEFGKDHPADVAFRSFQQQSLFGYEQHVAAVLSDVRLRYYLVLLREKQVAERRKLLAEFSDRHDRIRRLAEARRVLDVDVMTARLNVLNEETQINSLEKEALRQRMNLLADMGLPMERTELSLSGELEQFAQPLTQAVETALRRSISVVQARYDLFEQDRVVRQLIWEYLPALNTTVGYQGSTGEAGVRAGSANGNYSLGPYGGRDVDWRGPPLSPPPNWLLPGQTRGTYWVLDLDLPITTGLARTGKFQREEAMLDRLRHLLCQAMLQTQLGVGKAYEVVSERRKELSILQETVAISKERLRVHERLKELGRVTDNELETFRQRFFSDQDNYFERQIQLVEAQEQLRLLMRYFEPTEKERSQPDGKPDAANTLKHDAERSAP